MRCRFPLLLTVLGNPRFNVFSSKYEDKIGTLRENTRQGVVLTLAPDTESVRITWLHITRNVPKHPLEIAVDPHGYRVLGDKIPTESQMVWVRWVLAQFARK